MERSEGSRRATAISAGPPAPPAAPWTVSVVSRDPATGATTQTHHSLLLDQAVAPGSSAGQVARYEDYFDDEQTRRVADGLPRLLKLARQLAKEGDGRDATEQENSASIHQQQQHSLQRPVTGKARAREEIFLRRAQLAAELSKMGLPPMIDWAAGLKFGKVVVPDQGDPVMQKQLAAATLKLPLTKLPNTKPALPHSTRQMSAKLLTTTSIAEPALLGAAVTGVQPSTPDRNGASDHVPLEQLQPGGKSRQRQQEGERTSVITAQRDGVLSSREQLVVRKAQQLVRNPIQVRGRKAKAQMARTARVADSQADAIGTGWPLLVDGDIADGQWLGGGGAGLPRYTGELLKVDGSRPMAMDSVPAIRPYRPRRLHDGPLANEEQGGSMAPQQMLRLQAQQRLDRAAAESSVQPVNTSTVAWPAVPAPATQMKGETVDSEAPLPGAAAGTVSRPDTGASTERGRRQERLWKLARVLLAAQKQGITNLGVDSEFLFNTETTVATRAAVATATGHRRRLHSHKASDSLAPRLTGHDDDSSGCGIQRDGKQGVGEAAGLQGAWLQQQGVVEAGKQLHSGPRQGRAIKVLKVSPLALALDLSDDERMKHRASWSSGEGSWGVESEDAGDRGYPPGAAAVAVAVAAAGGRQRRRKGPAGQQQQVQALQKRQQLGVVSMQDSQQWQPAQMQGRKPRPVVLGPDDKMLKQSQRQDANASGGPQAKLTDLDGNGDASDAQRHPDALVMAGARTPPQVAAVAAAAGSLVTPGVVTAVAASGYDSGGDWGVEQDTPQPRQPATQAPLESMFRSDVEDELMSLYGMRHAYWPPPDSAIADVYFSAIPEWMTAPAPWYEQGACDPHPPFLPLTASPRGSSQSGDGGEKPM